jgi:hypothetical protein
VLCTIMLQILCYVPESLCVVLQWKEALCKQTCVVICCPTYAMNKCCSELRCVVQSFISSFCRNLFTVAELSPELQVIAELESSPVA